MSGNDVIVGHFELRKSRKTVGQITLWSRPEVPLAEILRMRGAKHFVFLWAVCLLRCLLGNNATFRVITYFLACFNCFISLCKNFMHQHILKQIFCWNDFALLTTETFDQLQMQYIRLVRSKGFWKFIIIFENLWPSLDSSSFYTVPHSRLFLSFFIILRRRFIFTEATFIKNKIEGSIYRITRKSSKKNLVCLCESY